MPVPSIVLALPDMIGVLDVLVWWFLTPEPVYPSRGNGFAATIVVALLAIGVLGLVARWISPGRKRRRRR